LQRRESRLHRIQAAKRALEARARDEATADGDAATAVKPPDTAQYNFTDPESRIMHHKPDGFVQGYNVQVAVEGTLQLIVGEAVTQETNDKRQLRPMIRTIQQQARQTPAQLLADSGYCSDESLRELARLPVDGYIATRRLTHSERPAPAPRGRIPRDATARARMARKLRTRAGAAIYATRKHIVEPVLGQIKQARGFRQFLLRGLEKVRAEWALVCATHNVLKLYRICRV
jgi:hypothetical protein